MSASVPGPLPARAFWFLRHGETDWNAANLSQGRTDVPLNDRGLAQAAAAAALMRGRGIACDLGQTLRFHGQCWHGPTSQRYPAMVALVQGSSQLAIHRTYLRNSYVTFINHHQIIIRKII